MNRMLLPSNKRNDSKRWPDKKLLDERPKPCFCRSENNNKLSDLLRRQGYLVLLYRLFPVLEAPTQALGNKTYRCQSRSFEAVATPPLPPILF